MTWENMYDTILVGKSKLLERIYGNLPPRFGKSKETMYKTVFLGTVSDFGKQVWTTFSLWQKIIEILEIFEYRPYEKKCFHVSKVFLHQDIYLYIKPLIF